MGGRKINEILGTKMFGQKISGGNTFLGQQFSGGQKCQGLAPGTECVLYWEAIVQIVG